MQERNIQTSADWRQQMSQVDVSILQHMRDNIKGGFDEERHGSRVGFGNLKRCAQSWPVGVLQLLCQPASRSVDSGPVSIKHGIMMAQAVTMTCLHVQVPGG